MIVTQTFTMRLLGPFEIEDSRSQPIKMRRKARALLAYLAVSSNLQPRHKLAAIFCAEAADPARALRLLLSRIRRQTTQNILITEGDTVCFNTQVGWVDCPVFEQGIKSGTVTPNIIKRFRGDFLDNLALPDAPEFELWILSRRSYYRQLYEHGLSRLISRLSDQAQYRAAIPFAQKLVQSNTLLEEGHASLIRLYAQTGQRAAALAQYDQCCAWLMQELAVEPGDMLRRLVTEIRSGQLGRPHLPHLQHRSHFVSQNRRLNYAELLINQVLLGDYVNLPITDEKELLHQAGVIIKENPDTRHEALSHLGWASHYKRKSQFAAAIEASTMAHEQFISLDETRYAARCLVLAGQAQIRISQNRTGRKSLEQALPLYETIGDYEGISICLSGMAWSALNLGEIERALSELNHALALVTKQQDILGQAHIYYRLAAAWNYFYHAENMSDNALKANRLYKQAGHERMAIRCHIYLAQAHRYRGEVEAATKLLAQLVVDAQKNHDSWLEAWVMSILNKIAFGRGDLNGAAKWTRTAYDLRQKTNEQQNQVYDLVWMSRLKLAQGDMPTALLLTKQAVEQMEKARREYYVWEAPDVYLSRAEALNAVGEGDQAQNFIRCAYGELQRFVGQVQTSNKRRVFDQMMGRRVITAWQRGEAQPFPNFANN